MAGFPSVLLVLPLALAGCVSVLGQAPANAHSSVARRTQCGPVCMVKCLYGNVLDWRGCHTCRCRDRCPPIKCFRPCPWGYKYFNDCPTCQCRCPPIKCFRPCPWGYRYINGCQTCQCRCPRIRCWRPCRWGYIYRNGCRTCQCRIRPWCPLRCYNPICWSVGSVDVHLGPCLNCPPGCRRLFIPQIHTQLGARASSSSDS